MACNQTQTPEIDLPALREKYRRETERRRRPEGFAQYLEARGELGEYFNSDPFSTVQPRAAVFDEVDVVVLGGEFAGLIAAGRLKEAGVDSVRIIERGGDFGGTWYWNRYPGVQCDVKSYTYLPMLEVMGYMPRDRYAYGPEIFEYCQQIGKYFDLYEQALFGTTVEALRWDAGIDRWRVATLQGDDIRARFVVMAPGPLNRPKLPNVPGIRNFKGHSFHTTLWDYEYTGGDPKTPVLDKLGDKRIAIIGTGATAIQCVPSLGKYAKHLTVFQRTPSYVDDRGNRPTDPEWARSLPPGWQNARMRAFQVGVNEGFDRTGVDVICDGWSEINRNIQARREAAGWPDLSTDEFMAMREEEDYRAMERIRQRVESVVTDKAAAEILKPWYRFLCKRPCFNDDYLPTFNRPNVTLVDVSDARGIDRITENGIVANGVEHQVDCIIYSTGFETTVDLRRRYGIDTIEGRGGLSIYDHWAEGFRTLHGMTVHNFPNLFFTGWLQGGLTGSVTQMYDQQAHHIAYILTQTLSRGAASVEPSREAEAAWVKTIRENLVFDKSFWSACTPGYNNDEGRGVDRYPIFGEPYGPGYDAFDALIREWRDKGSLDGLALG